MPLNHIEDMESVWWTNWRNVIIFTTTLNSTLSFTNSVRVYEKICFQVFFTQILSTRNKTTRKQLNIPTTVWGRYIYDMWYTVAEFTTLLLSHLGLVQSGSQPKQTFQKFRLDKPVRAQRGRWQQLRERAGLWNVAGLVCSSIMIKGRRCCRY